MVDAKAGVVAIDNNGMEMSWLRAKALNTAASAVMSAVTTVPPAAAAIAAACPGPKRVAKFESVEATEIS